MIKVNYSGYLSSTALRSAVAKPDATSRRQAVVAQSWWHQVQRLLGLPGLSYVRLRALCPFPLSLQAAWRRKARNTKEEAS